MTKRNIFFAISIVFVILWSGFVISAYFVAHRPLALQVLNPLLSLAWTMIVTSMLLFNALGLGMFTIKHIIDQNDDEITILILAGGLGMGELGLLGFAFAALGIAKFPMLLGIQIILLGWFVWRGAITQIFGQIGKLVILIKASGSNVPRWMRWAAAFALAITFLRTFLPPAEAYDALFYHLTVPQLWLNDGGLRTYDFLQYWFPGLAEGVYVWGMGLGSEISPQQLHLVWAVSMSLLLWDWARRVWSETTAWWVLVFIVSLPSLLLLASWAYTDMALSFFGVAMLYTLWFGEELKDTRWWKLSAIAAGMAVGVKYTGFFMPLTAMVMITVWKFNTKEELGSELLRFVSISGATGCIWYLRNWFWMGNPFYPFIFGGRYWDQFRADLLAGVGTGSGWDLKAIISLPLTVTLGYQDINGFDGDVGPLLLLMLPITLWVAIRFTRFELRQKRTLSTLMLFSGVGAGFWVYGYITAKGLWQTRLLFPAIIPSIMLAAFSMSLIQELDTKKLRVSFIVSSLVIASVFINLLDLGLSTTARNPLATATGIVSREDYMQKFQPEFTSAIRSINSTPQSSSIYFLFEPRIYGAIRETQPDSILDNFAHDVFLYKEPTDIIKAWRLHGYTHVLISIRGARLVLEGTKDEEILNETIRALTLITTTPDESYELFKIPSAK